MSPFETVFARGSLAVIDKLINEITVSVTLEESLCGLTVDDGETLLCMDLMRMESFWRDVNQQKLKLHALDYLFTKLTNNRNERVIMRILWGIDVLIEKMVFSPKEVAHALVCYDQLRLDSSPFFRCAFKLLIKLIFYLDYKSNREVFNKSVEKSSQFSLDFFDRRDFMRVIDPTVELIHLLLSREMCLMPAYFAMHELIRSFPSGLGPTPHKSILHNVASFMESFSRPARLLYSKVHQAIKPICGITASNSPGFRLDSSSLLLVSVKGAMRYPDFLTNPQISLLCHVLGQFRSTELTAGMLDSTTGKSKTRSTGLELALVDWIVELMKLAETADDRHWVRKMFEHLISVVITFMLSSTIRFNEIVVKLNSKLEGHVWTKSSHHIMWFVLNATSGFIGKNMLTDFVPCLRLFDILFPGSEDPDRAMELQTVGCSENCERWSTELISVAETRTDADLNGHSSQPKSPDVKPDGRSERLSQIDFSEADDLSDTSADESDDEGSLDILPPARHPTSACRRNHARLMHLTTAPVCLWQHVLRKSRTGHDHLPRVMPPALRPIEARISYRLRHLLDAIANPSSHCAPGSLSLSSITWKQLIIILNAYSTDNEANQLIQHLVDIFWSAGECGDGQGSKPDFLNTLWSKLFVKGPVRLPYGLVTHGLLQPLSHHLVRTMSVHLRMLILHLFLQKLSSLPFVEHLTTPAVIETMCRILACREVEPSNVGRILGLFPKLKPSWSVPRHEPDELSGQPPDSPTGTSTCYLLGILLDVLSHRLVDTFIPEVRTQTAVTLVALLRLWTSWIPGEISTELELPQSSTEVRMPRPGLPTIPLELFYMLEWSICKSVRSLQSPDSVIYGLCSVISPTSLTHNQTQGSGGSGFSNSPFSNVPGSSVPFAAARGVNTTARPSASGLSTEIPTSGSSGIGEATLPGPISGYPLLMSEYTELNRFSLFALLQIYYAFDLEEVSTMKAFLVEQFRTLFERCGLSSLSDLPTLLSGRLPDFLVHILRQRSSPHLPGSGWAVDGPDGKSALLQLPRLVAEDFDHLIDGSVTWTDIANTKNTLLCVVFRHLAIHGTIPTTATELILRMPFPGLNACLRMFCDYLVAILSSAQATGDDGTTVNDLLTVLGAFCLEWRIVPLDRLLMFLLTHTNYQGAQLTAVNSLLVHMFVRCPQVTDAIAYLSSQFPVNLDCPANSERSHRDLRWIHPDPLSSRHWPEHNTHLHELIPDMGIVNQNDPESFTSCDKPSSDPRLHIKLPVVYGHMLLRLLPVLETILPHFLETDVPLMQLIPFCRAIIPLFRFHRRPVNVCYMLLREHWHFVPMEPEGFWSRDITPNDGRRRWLIDRIRVQLIVYSVLCQHHALALSTATEGISKKRSMGHPIAGLFTSAAWSEVYSTYVTCVHFYEKIVEQQSGVESAQLAAAEIELHSKVCSWYRSHEKWVNFNYVFSLLEPIRLSTHHYGLAGHPAAWRPWNLEENVSIQAAGLFAASVELMSSFTLPLEFINALTEFIFSMSDESVVNEYLNIVGYLTAILPASYRLALCRFTTTLIDDAILTDPTVEQNWLQAPGSLSLISHLNTWGANCNRPERHARLLLQNQNLSDIADCTKAPVPPRVAVRFFDDLLKPDSNDASDSSPTDTVLLGRRNLFLKASLWHAIWAHANATQINALPSLFADLIVPRMRNEAQLLMSFYLVAPLMGSLHSERPAKLIDLTAELYRALRQVDAYLAEQHEDFPPGDKVRINSDDNSLYPPNTGTPLVHVDTIADLLYHVKYMYVGNGVLDHVRPILPRLRPVLRKRLKFILPPSESLQAEQQQIKQSVVDPNVAVFEGRVYKASPRPPVGDEDF